MALVRAQATTLEAVTGRELLWQFSVTDDAGVVINITGMSIVFVAAPRVGLVAELSTGAPLSNVIAAITDAAGGVFTIAITGAVIAALREKGYVWQCWVIDGSGDDAEVGWGPLIIHQGLTP